MGGSTRRSSRDRRRGAEDDDQWEEAQPPADRSTLGRQPPVAVCRDGLLHRTTDPRQRGGKGRAGRPVSRQFSVPRRSGCPWSALADYLVRERLNWIDWLKVLVVAGAFVFHAAQPFVYTEWLINDTDKSLPLSVLSGFGYMFGMPLMFFLAGRQLARRRAARHRWPRRASPAPAAHSPPPRALSSSARPGAWVAPCGRRQRRSDRIPAYRHPQPTLNPRWFGDVGHHLWFLLSSSSTS